MTRKAAWQLKSGDSIFDNEGKKLGILLSDAEMDLASWSGNVMVEFDIQIDDRIEHRLTVHQREYLVEEWQPSQAV